MTLKILSLALVCLILDLCQAKTPCRPKHEWWDGVYCLECSRAPCHIGFFRETCTYFSLHVSFLQLVTLHLPSYISFTFLHIVCLDLTFAYTNRMLNVWPVQHHLQMHNTSLEAYPTPLMDVCGHATQDIIIRILTTMGLVV